MIRLFHGGAAGRKAGDLLLPPCESGYKTHEQRWIEEHGIDARQMFGLGLECYRSDRVYLTTRRDLATAYAAAQELARESDRPGVLYTAEPVGEMEDDPDLPGISFQCARARVLKVYDPAVRMSFARFSRIMMSVVEIEGVH